MHRLAQCCRAMNYTGIHKATRIRLKVNQLTTQAMTTTKEDFEMYSLESMLSALEYTTTKKDLQLEEINEIYSFLDTAVLRRRNMDEEKKNKILSFMIIMNSMHKTIAIHENLRLLNLNAGTEKLSFENFTNEKLFTHLMSEYKKVIPSPDETDLLQSIVARVGLAVDQSIGKEIKRIKKIKHIELYCFGSRISNSNLKNADVDLSLNIHGCFPNRSKRRADPFFAKMVLHVVEHLKIHSFIDFKLILQGRFPLIKFKDLKSKFNCDFVFSEHELNYGIVNSMLLKNYIDIGDERVKQMMLLVKHWALQKNICDAASGYLSSYSYSLLVIHFLQNIQPPILPFLQSNVSNLSNNILGSKEEGKEEFSCDFRFHSAENAKIASPDFVLNKNESSIEELLFNFFKYYVDFNYKENVISIKHENTLKAIDVNQRIKRFSTFSHPNFLILDPFEDRNLGSVLYPGRTEKIQREMLRAMNYMKSNDSNKFDFLFRSLRKSKDIHKKERKRVVS